MVLKAHGENCILILRQELLAKNVKPRTDHLKKINKKVSKFLLASTVRADCLGTEMNIYNVHPLTKQSIVQVNFSQATSLSSAFTSKEIASD